MKGKFYGLVAVIIGLFFLIPAVRDLRRGYSVERNKRSGNTRISKPPEIGYYFGVGVMLSVGSVFTTLGLASILIPLQGRKRERRGNKGNQGYSIPFLETSYVRSVVGYYGQRKQDNVLTVTGRWIMRKTLLESLASNESAEKLRSPLSSRHPISMG